MSSEQEATKESFVRRRPVLLVTLTVGVIVIALVAVLATRSTNPGAIAETPLIGQSAPSISGTNLLTGKQVDLSSYKGHFVVVNFFASWCLPCASEEPQLVAFLYAERSIHAQVIGVVYQDSASNATAFVRKYGASWPIVADPQGSFAAEYGVDDPPRSYVIAPDGKVAWAIVGQVTESRLLQLVSATAATS